MSTNQSETGSLFPEFQPVRKAEWEEIIRKQGYEENVREKLDWDTLEGFTVSPFYTKEDLAGLTHDSGSPVHNTTRWTCTEPVFASDPVDANASIKKALDGGVTAFLIPFHVMKGEGILGGDCSGTQLQSPDDVNALVKGVENEDIEFIFDSGPASPALLAMVQNSSIDPVRGSFMYDPFTYVAKHGRLPLSESKLKQMIRQLGKNSPSRIFCADGSFYHHCGATIVQELGIALAVGSEFLAMTEPDQQRDAARLLFVRVAAGPLYFPEIAKFRALRLLWDQLLQAYNVDSNESITIFAETSRVNKTVTDPHNNRLRTVTEAMAAIIGGTDYLVAEPYSALFEEPGDFSKRMARNIQHILGEEAHFDKVADPSSGSYYIEHLTETIAQHSWHYFRRIEQEGGFLQSLKNGLIQHEIKKAKEKKESAYDTGKRVLVGTNTYPDTGEILPEQPFFSDFTTSLRMSDPTFTPEAGDEFASLKHAVKEGALLGDVISSVFEPQKVLYRTMEEFRAGQIFDEIRLKTEYHSKKRGGKPVVQLVPVGDMKRRNARAAFAQNMLGCGGFEVINPPGFETIEDAIKQMEKITPDLFVLCSSDHEYETIVEPFCKAFSDRGLLMLAGHPGARESVYRKSGLNHFIYKGMNLPDILAELQKKLFKTGEEK